MALGNVLDGGDQQYVALKDETNTWRVLNTWHNDLKLLDADSDIPDDSEAVTVLSEGQFIALIKEAAVQGVLSNATFTNNTDELDSKIEEQSKTISDLKLQLEKVNNSEPPKSEHYALRVKAMDTLKEMFIASETTYLSKE